MVVLTDTLKHPANGFTVTGTQTHFTHLCCGFEWFTLLKNLSYFFTVVCPLSVGGASNCDGFECIQ